MSRMCRGGPSARTPTRPGLRQDVILRRSRTQQQVLQVRGDRGQVLERLDRLLAAVRVPRAQRRGQDLLEQRRLAVGRGAEHAQVAPADAEARQLGHGADDLALGVVVERLAVAALALDHAVLLELLDERAVGAGLLEHVVQPVQRAPALCTATVARAQRARVGRAAGLAAPPRARRGPAASSWRITRSGRNSSRWRRRIVRSRSTSPGV